MVDVAARTTVIEATSDHAELLAEFYRSVWDRGATAESVTLARRRAAQCNPHGRGLEVPTFLFIDGGRAVGHLTTIPFQLWHDGTERAAHWLKGLMVLPEYRNGPVGFLLLRHAIERTRCAMALVVQADARRLFTALRFADLGVMTNNIRVLRGGRVLRSLDLNALGMNSLPAAVRLPLRIMQRSAPLAAVAGSALDLGTRALGMLGMGHRPQRVPRLDRAGMASLWDSARGTSGSGPSRSDAALSTRYEERDREYEMLEVRSQRRLVGIAAVRRPTRSDDPRLAGLRIATLSDIAADLTDRKSVLGLIRGAENAARALGADALLCSATDPRLIRRLRVRGFVPVPGNIHVLLRDPEGGLPLELSRWHLMRGDSSADEVF